MIRRDQRAVCFASRAAVAPFPSRRRPFRFSNRTLVTSLHGAGPQERRASVCGSAAGVALRLRFARRFSPLSAPLPRSPTQTEAKQSVAAGPDDGLHSNSSISNWRIQIIRSMIGKLPSHSARRRDSAMKGEVDCMAASGASRILRFVASVPP
jgi:hypothetical protein